MHSHYPPSNSSLPHPSSLPLKAWEQVALRHYARVTGQPRHAYLADWFTLALLLRQSCEGANKSVPVSSAAPGTRTTFLAPARLAAKIENRLYALFAE